MQIAAVNDSLLEAFPGGRGHCPHCQSTVIAKCGPRVMHHWSHLSQRNCDPWWENETLWHREWKNFFPLGWREVTRRASDGEIHRADIKTPTGLYVELQHSTMTDAERQSREEFYQNLVWVIDGRSFRKNFNLFHPLPDPFSEIAKDLVWYKATRHQLGAANGLFYRLSENREDDSRPLTKTTAIGRLVLTHGLREIENEINEVYRGHHQYDWIRPHRTWLDAACPVYIDFGVDWLFRLEIYDETGLPCVRLIAKQKFIYDVTHGSDARSIGT